MLLFLCGLSAHYPLWFLALIWPVAAVLAVLLDRLLGEPARFHPLVGFGRYASWLERHLNRGERRLWRGCLALLLALLPLSLIGLALFWLAQQSLWGWLLAEVLVLYSCIGWQSLKQHVLAVEQALNSADLPLAQQKLSWIVSRSTGGLDENEVAQADIESLLENSSDALFASLFWFALGGGLAALLHRWVNTLDAMWGYRNERFNLFGRWAARMDDALAFWPARITALAFALVSGRYVLAALRCWREQARACSSPNGGVVMTTGAGALHVRLSARACYHGEWQQKPPMGCGRSAQTADIRRGVALVSRALWLLLLSWLALFWLPFLLGNPI